MSLLPSLNINGVADPVAQRNFQNIQVFFQGLALTLLGLQFQEVDFTKAVSNVLIAHGLPQAPTDVMITRLTGPGSVIFNFGLFDNTNLNISTSGACRVRFLYGNPLNQAIQNSAKTDSQTYSGGT